MKRYVMLSLISLIGILVLYLGFKDSFINFIATLIMCFVVESFAIALSEFALFAYTKVPFTKLLIEGENQSIQAYERGWVLRLAGQIFVGVHILLSVIIAGVYFVQFN